MKKITAIILVLCLVCSVLCGCGKTETSVKPAAAETSEDAYSETPAGTANDVSEDPVQAAPTEEPEPKEDKEIVYQAPTASDLQNVEVRDIFQYPDENSYLASKEKMFVVQSPLAVLPTVNSPQTEKDPVLSSGDEVEVIAKQKGFFCIICNVGGKDVAGWVLKNGLSYNDPGHTQKNISAAKHYGTPSDKTIRNCGQEKSITLPLEEEYISSFDNMYVCQDAVYPVPNPDGSAAFNECRLLVGDEVNVIALNKNHACILMMTDSGEKAGWVLRSQLSYNNPKNDPTPVTAVDHTGTPSVKTIEEMGLDKSITLPEDDEYIAGFDQMYVLADTAQVFANEDRGGSMVVCTLTSGSEVNILAIREGFALILYETDAGEKAGWISQSNIRYNNPRKELKPTVSKSYSGTPSIKDIEQLRLEKSMTLPSDEMYTSSYDRMFVVSNVLKVFSDFDYNSVNEVCSVASGSEVSIIAISKGYACVLFETDEGTKCGWLALGGLSYNSPSNKQKPVKAVSHSGKPSIKTLESMGLDKSIILPDDESYISSFDNMYVTEPLLQVYSHHLVTNRNISFSLVAGSEVNVIALQNKFALILAQTEMGEKAGWVAQESLSYNNPNNSLEIVNALSHDGTPSEKTLENMGLDKSIILPDSDEYISSFDKMYNTVVYNQVYSHHVGNIRNVTFSMLKGTEVNVIAIQNKYALILVQTDAGEKAGWVLLESLSYNNPEVNPEPTVADEPDGTPSDDFIEKLGLDKSLTMPENDMYLPRYQHMFVLQANTQIMSFKEAARYIVSCTLQRGSEVYVTAISKQYAFITFDTDEGTKCGWVQLQNLGYNNPLNKPEATEASVPSGSPGVQCIENLGLEKSMTLPNDSSYTDSYAVMQTNSNAPAYSFNGGGLTTEACTVALNSTVIQFAKQNGFACVLCETDSGTKAVWISQVFLKEK